MVRNFDDTGAQYRSEEDCEQIAVLLRRNMGYGVTDRLPPVMEVFDAARRHIPQAARLELIVEEKRRLGRAKAFARPADQEIYVGQPLLEDALEDRPDARFDLIHEFVHVLLHKGQDRFYLIDTGNVTYTFLRDEERAEWQADTITRNLLMPREMVLCCSNAGELSKKAGAPIQAAITRLKSLGAATGRKLDPKLAATITTLRIQCATDPAERARLQREHQKLELWNRLPQIATEDPSLYRECETFRICWHEFGKTTECGWYIDGGCIRSFFARRNT